MKTETNPIETFSEVLSCLMLAEFGSIEKGIEAVSKKTEIPAEVLYGYLTGEIVPRPESAARLATAFKTTENPIAEFGLVSLAASSLEFAMKEDEANAQNSTPKDDAQFSASQAVNVPVQEAPTTSDAEASPDVDEKEIKINELQAKLQQIEYERELERKLHALNARAQEGVAKGWLPPIIYKTKFDKLNTTDYVAAFSSVCRNEKVDVDKKLYALNELLDTLQSCGRWQMINEYGKEEQASFSSTEEPSNSSLTENGLDEDKLALLNAYLYKQSK